MNTTPSCVAQINKVHAKKLAEFNEMRCQLIRKAADSAADLRKKGTQPK